MLFLFINLFSEIYWHLFLLLLLFISVTAAWGCWLLNSSYICMFIYIYVMVLFFSYVLYFLFYSIHIFIFLLFSTAVLTLSSHIFRQAILKQLGYAFSWALYIHSSPTQSTIFEFVVKVFCVLLSIQSVWSGNTLRAIEV